MQTALSNRTGGAKGIRANAPTLHRSFVLESEYGLHSRPCALLIKTLKPFCSEVLVEANGERASGRSIMGLMILGAAYGSTITFTITGPDAAQAMAAVERLFATRFAEAYGLPTSQKDPASQPQIGKMMEAK